MLERALILLIIIEKSSEAIFKFRFANFATTNFPAVVEAGGKYVEVQPQDVSPYLQVDLPDSNPYFYFVAEGKNLKVDILYDNYQAYLVVLFQVGTLLAKSYPDIDKPQARFNISNPYDLNLMWRLILIPPDAVTYTILERSDVCVDCDYQVVNFNITTLFTYDNSIGRKWYRLNYTTSDGNNYEKQIAEKTNVDSQGIYTMFYVLGSGTFIQHEDYPPESFYTPLLILLVSTMVVVLIRLIYIRFKNKYGKRHFRMSRSIRTKQTDDQSKRFARMQFVDSIRGMAMCLLLFCNLGGGNYNFFTESLWTGITYADFPEYTIAWIMGFCIPIAHKNKARTASSRNQDLLTIIFQGILLILCGIFCNRNDSTKTMVFLGFLQHIGFGYIVVASLYTIFPFDRRSNVPYLRRKTLIIRSSLLASLPLTNFMLSRLYPVPNCERGYYGPGGLALPDQPIPNGNCTGGFAGYLDKLVFGEAHLPSDFACKFIFQCSSFSRYSLLSALNFCLIVYLGLIVGEYFIANKRFNRRMSFMLIITLGSFIIAAILGLIDEDVAHGLIPISKPLWSISFIFILNFVVMIFFLFMYVCNELKIFFGWPFKAVGLNALFIYIIFKVIGNRFPFGFLNNGSHLSMIVSNLVGVTVWISGALVLHHYRFYVKY